MRRRINSSVSYFRNFVFGVEDSLVSTVGLLSGIAVANVQKSTLLLTGIILLFVEAISMAAGSFLSEYSAEEYNNHTERLTKNELVSAIVMFFSYLISGFIPLVPYAIWPVKIALFYSVISSIIFLFILGVVGGKVTNTNMIKNGLRMVLIGGIAISVGIIAGNFISNL